MTIKKEYGALKELNEMFTLTESIELYIPTETASGDVVSNKEVLEHCSLTIEEAFGGATVVDGKGYWSDSLGTLYTENVNIIQSNTNELDDKKAYLLMQLARYVKKELKQQAVTITVNGKMKFI